MRKKYLGNIALFSVLFILFMLLGSLLWSWQQHRMAIICFVLALPAVFGQLFTIVLLAREQNSKALASQAQQNITSANTTIQPTATTQPRETDKETHDE